MREIIGFIILGLGILFDFFGCLGLVRLPDLYSRLQAGTKCVTLGTCLLSISVIILLGGSASAKALLIILLIFIILPTAAHALSRASHQAGVELGEKSICDALKKNEK